MTMKRTVAFLTALLLAPLLALHAAEARPAVAKPTKPPLTPADITQLPEGTGHLDLYLLIGQSNMKGRGFMPEEPARDPRIAMMHLKNDRWYVARHPLHLSGDPQTFAGADNAGVGPGLSFAQTLAAQDSTARIGLIPCAVGGTQIARWQKGAGLYEEAIRRTKLALEQTKGTKATLRGVLWLQGEADSKADRVKVYAEKLNALVDALRADLGQPALPFVACTIGEMRTEGRGGEKQAINALLLDLPNHRPHTACVDARDLKSSIGDNVHYDTAAQTEIGKRFAASLQKLTR